MGLRKKLQEIYAEVPRLDCKGLCHHQCTVIPTSPAEDEVIHEHHGIALMDTDDLSVGHMAILELSGGTLVPECPALTKDKRCSIYEDRPLICRLYGVVKKLKCPHGCKPAVWLPDSRAHALIDRVEEL